MEHEALQTLANVKGLETASWDSLGQWIVLVLIVGPENGRSIRYPVHMRREAAIQLLSGLEVVLEEKPDAGWSKQ